jgi:hypothetical protein
MFFTNPDRYYSIDFDIAAQQSAAKHIGKNPLLFHDRLNRRIPE